VADRRFWVSRYLGRRGANYVHGTVSRTLPCADLFMLARFVSLSPHLSTLTCERVKHAGDTTAGARDSDAFHAAARRRPLSNNRCRRAARCRILASLTMRLSVGAALDRMIMLGQGTPSFSGNVRSKFDCRSRVAEHHFLRKQRSVLIVY
jgi:hypothetical protein